MQSVRQQSTLRTYIITAFKTTPITQVCTLNFMFSLLTVLAHYVTLTFVLTYMGTTELLAGNRALY